MIVHIDDLYARLDAIGKAAMRWRILCGEPIVFDSEWLKERMT